MAIQRARPASDDRRRGKEAKDVIRRILERQSSGASMKSRSVLVEDVPLARASIRLFQNWGNALRAAGMDAEVVLRRRKWTVARIVGRIRELERQGAALNHVSVVRADYGLVNAAQKLLGSWENALRKAGYDPDAVRKRRRPWTKSQIILALQAHAERHLPLTQNALSRTSILCGAKRLFGSLRAALRQAELLHMVPKRPQWSKADVVAAIRQRQCDNLPLHSAAVARMAPPLYSAARTHYGGWDPALRAAKLDPCRIRKARPDWTPELVIKEIRKRTAAGEAQTPHTLNQPQSLMRACRRFFSSWEEAVWAAESRKGPPPAKRRTLMTKSDVLKAILQLEAGGLPLNPGAVVRHDLVLYRAIHRIFGHYDNAMRAAGIDPACVRRQQYWSREDVLNGIRRRAEQGREMALCFDQHPQASLVDAAARWFSSWDEACRAAGVHLDNPRRSAAGWTRLAMVRRIREVHALGKKINFKRHPGSFCRAAMVLFGSWDAMLRAAGLDPGAVRVRRASWTSSSILLEIQRKWHAGEPLNAGAVEPESLRRVGATFFGSWDAALAAAGLDPDKVRKKAR
ncbi:MAG: hypothetical protein NTW87_14375 [Planctomycetota bacterium]|nr:hypothetical protein [Planctomycetota bacterium]